MLLKAAVKFSNGKRHFLPILFAATGMIIFVLKSDGIVFFVNRFYTVGGDGYLVRIPAQVFQHPQRTAEGLFRIHVPMLIPCLFNRF